MGFEVLKENMSGKMNTAKRELLRGTSVYMIGNVLVALLQLIMLRFITENIQTGGYGYYNLIVTIDNLITPILTLQISSAVFKWVIRGDIDQKRSSYTCGVIIIIFGIILTAVGVYIASAIFTQVEYPLLVILYIVSTNIFTLYQKMARALKKDIEFVKSNLLKAFLYLCFQFLFIIKLNMKEESLFLSSTISTFVCIIVLEIRVKCRNLFSLSAFDKKVLKAMLFFSIPLIPNSLLWWLSSSVNGVIVSSFLGLGANGLYSVAGKFASIITMATSVFELAWQESAIKEYGNKGSTEFYKDTFLLYYKVLFSIVLVFIPLMKIVLPYMIDSEYSEAMLYAPLLVLGAGLSGMYGFFGQMYAATGKTKGIVTTTLAGVVVNFAIVLSLTHFIGLFASCLAVICSSFSILVMRYRYFREEMNLSVPKNILGLCFLLIIDYICYYWGNARYNIVLTIIMIVFALIFNKAFIRDILSYFVSIIKKK